MNTNDKILITGARGLLGTALCDILQSQDYNNILAPSSKELDLANRQDTIEYFNSKKPDYVFHLAGAIFGLLGNMKNHAYSYVQNTLINTHVIEAAQKSNVKKILGMGTIAAYPHPAPTDGPLKEEMIFQGRTHPGEFAYGHAKRSMLIQLEAFEKSYQLPFAFVVSTNLYGPADKFDIENGHVVPSLIRKFFLAKTQKQKIVIWGDGESKRDFMYSYDAARALITIMQKLTGPINLATGKMSKIKDVVQVLTEITNTSDLVEYDTSKPKGHDFQGFDISKLQSLGFTPEHSLSEGLKKTYNWYNEHHLTARHK